MIRDNLWTVAAQVQSQAEINTDGIIGFFLSKIAPILLAILGLIFIARANKGEVSRVLTSSTIAILGIAFIAGAVILVAVGNGLVDVLFREE
jgi:small-conductance mechanosensitive channel